MNDLFLMNLDTLEEFYIRCHNKQAVTLEDKNKILLDLLAEKKVAHLGSTPKSGPELATDLIKKGIKAQSIGFKAKKPTEKS